MGLNKSKGNMYDFITHTWNPIKGRCPHQCSYCYMDRIFRRFRREVPPMYIDDCELKANMGKGNFIFVGSSIDMWAEDVMDCAIAEVLAHCRNYANHYLFQTKNPKRFSEFSVLFPLKSCFCTTLESSRYYPEIMGNAPSIRERIDGMSQLKEWRRMITIEPILDFDLPYFLKEIIDEVQPLQVNIGADSGNNHLPEPPKEKILALIDGLKEAGIKVLLKKNLKRLIGDIK